MTTTKAATLFQQADDAWHMQLTKTYGRKAQSIRYLVQGQGQEGTPLRAAYNERHMALKAWRDSIGNDAL